MAQLTKVFLFLIIRIIFWGAISFLLMMLICSPEIERLLNH